MASLFSHAFTALAIGSTYTQKASRVKFYLLGCFCAVIPDADVLMFRFVSYEHPLGHRGFFHSFFFCLILSLLLTFIFYRKEKGKIRYVFFFFLCGASHALLDMLTNGRPWCGCLFSFQQSSLFLSMAPHTGFTNWYSAFFQSMGTARFV